MAERSDLEVGTSDHPASPSRQAPSGHLDDEDSERSSGFFENSEISNNSRVPLIGGQAPEEFEVPQVGLADNALLTGTAREARLPLSWRYVWLWPIVMVAIACCSSVCVIFLLPSVKRGFDALAGRAFAEAGSWRSVPAGILPTPQSLPLLPLHLWATTTLTTTSTSTTSTSATSTSTTSTSTTSTSTTSMTTTSTTWTLTATTSTVTTLPMNSLFCFSLMQSWSPAEVALVRLQSELKASIFACEETAVYSDRVISIGDFDDFQTTLLPNTNLRCNFGGPGGTALNTWIFKNLWRFVMDEGRWKRHDWTVKTDPDAVFFPWRLRNIARDPFVKEAGLENRGILLNNCKFGLHGPIEALSKKAVEAFSGHMKYCGTPPQEDVYLRECLGAAGVRELDAFSMLAEAHCDHPDFWGCWGNFVAFHPFKDTYNYRRCYYAGNR
ncbi:unnamed protein product [Polarella glacialis]|uniref:Uncharacterized protein n=1 Tax=Polarella glacialis TaxID=89957 RepID=A0A813D509_POLGL|nr:unnamed protein product [Polarella glacialis]